MNLFFGIFPLLIVAITARGVPKIDIYEIQENENGIELKNLNPNPKSNPRSDPLLKLLRGTKSENQVRIAKQLLSKLKPLRDDNSVHYPDDAFIYIVNGGNLDYDTRSSEEIAFIDKTRNDREVGVDKNDIKDLLLQLLQPDRKIQLQRKRRLRQKSAEPLRNPVLGKNVFLVEARPSSSRNKNDFSLLDDNDGNN